MFWKEYGIIRKHLIQDLFSCVDSFYRNKDSIIREMNSLHNFRKEVNTYENIDFKEQSVPKLIVIPTKATTNGTTSGMSSTTPPNNTATSLSTKPDGNGLQIWHFFVCMLSKT